MRGKGGRKGGSSERRGKVKVVRKENDKKRIRSTQLSSVELILGLMF